jgi:hypothetical protein
MNKLVAQLKPNTYVKDDKGLDFKTLPEFIKAFSDLKICKTPEQTTELEGLTTELHAKSPEMLAGILDLCQWLKGKNQDEFMHSVAVRSMQMELADIFDQVGFDALPNGMQPTSTIMLGTHGGDGRHHQSLFDSASQRVLQNTYNKFSQWINGQQG